LTEAKGEESNKGYKVVVTAQNTGDQFTVIKKANGEVEHKCSSTTSQCPGKTTSSSSW
jgi:hypothetical protein